MDFSLTARQVGEFLGREVYGENISLNSLRPINDITDNSIVFLNKYSEEYYEKVKDLKNNLIICTNEYIGKLGTSYIISENPRLDFIKVMRQFFYEDNSNTGVKHRTAIIESESIGHNVTIQANAYIGKEVLIGDDTYIGQNVVIVGRVSIGKGCYIKPGAVIGETGFGFENDANGVPLRFPHIGSIEIGNNVFIGSNTTIERATLGVTKIEDNVKIDDLVQIGHNCTVRNAAFIMAGVILCGGVTIGEGCWIAPNTIIKQKLTIGNKAYTGLGSIVVKNVEDGELVYGNPAKSKR